MDNRDLKHYEADLKTFAKRAFPFATKQTVNKAAFTARGHAIDNVKEKMITRNRFTVQSIRAVPTRTLNISRQQARTGSTQEYMADQEFGATKLKRGKQGVVIPTSYSAGQAENSRPRTRLPRKANTMAQIQLKKGRRKPASRKQRNIIAIKQAVATGRKFVFLDLARRKGIFKVTGGKRRPKLHMVYDMTRSSVKIPATPWLGPATAQTEKEIPAIYRDAIIFQLKRHRIFRKF